MKIVFKPELSIKMWLSCFILILTFNNVEAQILNPVHWSYSVKKAGKNNAEVLIVATIDKGWHIYSTRQKDGGPVKTSFNFDRSSAYIIQGTVTEPRTEQVFDKTFDMQVLYFAGRVIFKQKIRLLKTPATIKGKLCYMVCNDHQCLPPEDVIFNVKAD